MRTAAWILVSLASVICISAQNTAPNGRKSPHDESGPLFQTSDRCIACHNGLSTSKGEDISIGLSWRPSMMANSGRDPYWMGSVRRELMDHPSASALINDECQVCHLPMARTADKAAGKEPQILSHFPYNVKKPGDRLAADGVSCSLCHQIEDQKLGKKESFVGGYVIDLKRRGNDRREYGPFEIDKGHTRIMDSSAGYTPTQSKHIQSSELCATCHTLYTQALDATGKVIGQLPEQVPYQEWLHSDYKDSKSCQACHMPVVEEAVAVTSIMGSPREKMARHTFVGGNFFMQRMINKFRNDLNVIATSQELDAAAERTMTHLRSEAAKIAIETAEERGGWLEAQISVENLGGHKLPTAYPSRRVWLHVTIRDRDKKVVFESGALRPDGSIVGNDNDADPLCFEPHYSEINSPDQVQIYESILQDGKGTVTTGLLTALSYMKDNRLLPHGFDKTTAEADIAVHGSASGDADFAAGGDKIRYSAALGGAQGPFTIEAELWYQPIGFRWAMNLKKYDAAEPRRFTEYYESLASVSGVVLAYASRTVPLSK